MSEDEAWSARISDAPILERIRTKSDMPDARMLYGSVSVTARAARFRLATGRHSKGAKNRINVP